MLAVLTCVNIVLICCMFVVLFCRVSNNEKKLEAVRSGVRAISVSGKIEIMHTHSQIDWFRSLISSLVPATVFLSVFPFPATSVVVFCVSLFSSLSGLPLPLCLSLSHPVLSVPAFFCLLPPLPIGLSQITLLYSHPFTLFLSPSNSGRLSRLIGCRPSDIDTP